MTLTPSPRTAVVRTNLTPAEHKAFSRACDRLHAQKAEVLRVFALWITAHQAELAAQPDWLARQLDDHILGSA
jgi:hypothetical protein